MKPKSIKTFTVKRYVIEYYEVEALDREHAKKMGVENPSRIDIIKEVIKMKKS